MAERKQLFSKASYWLTDMSHPKPPTCKTCEHFEAPVCGLVNKIVGDRSACCGRHTSLRYYKNLTLHHLFAADLLETSVKVQELVNKLRDKEGDFPCKALGMLSPQEWYEWFLVRFHLLDDGADAYLFFSDLLKRCGNRSAFESNMHNALAEMLQRMMRQLPDFDHAHLEAIKNALQLTRHSRDVIDEPLATIHELLESGKLGRHPQLVEEALWSLSTGVYTPCERGWWKRWFKYDRKHHYRFIPPAFVGSIRADETTTYRAVTRLFDYHWGAKKRGKEMPTLVAIATLLRRSVAAWGELTDALAKMRNREKYRQERRIVREAMDSVEEKGL